MPKVLSVVKIENSKAYDITVPGPHSYFAGPKNNQVLVHNCRHWIIDKLLGPTIHECLVDKLVPRIEITRTAFSGPIPKTWVYMVNKLENDPKRLLLIARTAIADVKAGHLVLIPFSRVNVIKALTRAINIEANQNIAESFYGGQPMSMRKDIIDKARNYVIKILVGNIRLLSTGINIPRASCLFECTPSSNGPQAEQRFSRVLTPMPGKPQPLIRYFADDFSLRKNCISSEFFTVLWPMFRPQMSPAVKEDFFSYMKKNSKGKEVLGGVI